MLNDLVGAGQIYIACGYADLRNGIGGFATLVGAVDKVVSEKQQ